jgi:cysteine desulfuration protein SufE
MPTLQELMENFRALVSPDDKFAYLVELGRLLPPLERDDALLVPGCASKVWMRAAEKGGIFRFDFDSDAAIVRGMLYILRAMFDGKARGEIRAMDAEKALDGLGFVAFLSAGRQVGLKSILQSIRSMVQ